jgi:hypothetical protein
MKLISCCLLLVGISLGRGAIASSDNLASELERAGNSWQQGEPIPPQLLAYRPSYKEGYCFPDPDGTQMIFQGITNFALLHEVGGSLDPDPDPTSPFYDPDEGRPGGTYRLEKAASDKTCLETVLQRFKPKQPR